MAGKISEVTSELFRPIIEGMGLELVDVEYVKEGKNWFLRVFIDSPSGIDIDTCAQVSEQLSEVLDSQDPIKDAYFLEVSSPGAERPLKTISDYHKSIGKAIRVTTYEPINGEKAFEGILENVTETHLIMKIAVKAVKKQVDIPINKLASARLAVIF